MRTSSAEERADVHLAVKPLAQPPFPIERVTQL